MNHSIEINFLTDPTRRTLKVDTNPKYNLDINFLSDRSAKSQSFWQKHGGKVLVAAAALAAGAYGVYKWHEGFPSSLNGASLSPEDIKKFEGLAGLGGSAASDLNSAYMQAAAADPQGYINQANAVLGTRYETFADAAQAVSSQQAAFHNQIGTAYGLNGSQVQSALASIAAHASPGKIVETIVQHGPGMLAQTAVRQTAGMALGGAVGGIAVTAVMSVAQYGAYAHQQVKATYGQKNARYREASSHKKIHHAVNVMDYMARNVRRDFSQNVAEKWSALQKFGRFVASSTQAAIAGMGSNQKQAAKHVANDNQNQWHDLQQGVRMLGENLNNKRG